MFLRRMAVLLSAGALAAGLSMATAGIAHATINPDPNWNEIIAVFDHNFNNTLCVDDPSHDLAAGTQIQLWHCHGSGSDGAPQRWRFAYVYTDPNGIPGYAIFVAGSSMCLSDRVGNSLPASGKRLGLVDCSSVDSNYWLVDSNDDGSLLTLRDPIYDLCVAAADFSDNNGTPLIETPCANSGDSGLAQAWALG